MIAFQEYFYCTHGDRVLILWYFSQSMDKVILSCRYVIRIVFKWEISFEVEQH